MKFRVTRTSGQWNDDAAPPCDGAAREGGDDWFVEIADLEALCALVKKEEAGDGIIVSFPHDDEPFLLEIYDGWRE